MFIQTEKYTIRAWQKNDAESLAENANNIRIWNNVRNFFPYPYTKKDAKAFIKEALKKKRCEDFAIVVENRAVGGIGFVPGYDIERLNGEIGYWISEDFWNKGIMTNVLKDTVDFIFRNTEIIRLFTLVFEFNEGSMRVLEKAGFKKVAILKKAAIKNHKIINMHYFELLK